MSDLAGAIAAIQDHVRDNWITIPTLYDNEPQFEAPLDVNGAPSPWGYLEVLPTTSDVEATGSLKTWAYYGVIMYHVFIPVGTGIGRAMELATAVGELFRAQVLYDNGDGCHVRTVSPAVARGGPSDDAGQWFRVSMTVDFTYWHLA